MPHDDRSAIRRVNDTHRDLPLVDSVTALCASFIHENGAGRKRSAY